jgi:integrase
MNQLTPLRSPALPVPVLVAAAGDKASKRFLEFFAATIRNTHTRRAYGKAHKMPCHHNLEEYLTAYIDGCKLREDPKGPLFRTIPNRGGQLTRTAMEQPDAYRMIGRRATAAGIGTKVGNHSFRATGITAYLKNSGTLEKAAAMANHPSTRTTQLYDRRHEEMSLDEVERIGI